MFCCTSQLACVSRCFPTTSISCPDSLLIGAEHRQASERQELSYLRNGYWLRIALALAPLSLDVDGSVMRGQGWQCVRLSHCDHRFSNWRGRSEKLWKCVKSLTTTLRERERGMERAAGCQSTGEIVLLSFFEIPFKPRFCKNSSFGAERLQLGSYCMARPAMLHLFLKLH